MEEYDWVNIIPVLVGGCLSVRQRHMTNISTAISELPPEQQAIRDKCFHPTGKFIEFKKEEVEQSIPERFEQMVRMYPDRLAVKTRSHIFTYNDLNKAANRIAQAILAKRGETQEPTALLFEDDAPVIAAILGVLKTGKMYVPLDPSYPKARISSILDDSQAGLLITDNKNFKLAAELTKDTLQIINVDELDVGISNENPKLAVSPNTLASLFYTSGSTGQPKGVVKNHRNLLHIVMLYTNNFHIHSEDRQTLLFSNSFGPSGKNTFGSLLNGAATVRFNTREQALSDLPDWLIEQNITVYYSSVSVFRNFVSNLTGEEAFPSLRLIHLGGDRLSRSEIDLYKKHFAPECFLVNVLALTEVEAVRWYFIDKNTQINGSMVPVGYPVEDKEILLLDDEKREVGVDQDGEIAVKSRYISPGYWRRPDLTQAAFLPDPKGGDERIYLTGDLGRMSEDGCLEHFGRKDDQVKIRGYRVEVAETEAALLRLDNIKSAFVTAQEERLGVKRLVAYLVLHKHPAPTVSTLRRNLAETLPDYMLPSLFVILDALPLTPTGKVDRKVLPVPHGTRPELDNPYVAPRTPVEKELTQIWAEVLSLDQVGIQDNFFDLGGHSLAASQVISRVINTFKVELPIKSLFDSPTIVDMAVVITENMAKKAGDEELARMLTELESLSDEEAQRRLAEEGK